MKITLVTTSIIAWLAGSSLAQDTLCNGLVGTATLNSSIMVDISINLPCEMTSTNTAVTFSSPMPVSSWIPYSPETDMSENDLSLPENSISGENTNVHTVQVGMQGQLLFNPSQVQAQKGDIVLFIFHKVNHTVTESTLTTPCEKIPGGFDSGFRYDIAAPGSSRIVAFDVRDETPRWFFCAQGVPQSHCEAGMVFGLNPGDSMNLFLDNAQKIQPATTTPSFKTLPAPFYASEVPNAISLTSTSESVVITASFTTFIENTAASTTAIVVPPKYPNTTTAYTTGNNITSSNSTGSNTTGTNSTSPITSGDTTTTTSAAFISLISNLIPAGVLPSSLLPTAVTAAAASSGTSVRSNSIFVINGTPTPTPTPTSTQTNTSSTGTQTALAANDSGVVARNSTPAGIEQVQTFTGTGVSMQREAFGWMLAVSLMLHSVVYLVLA